MKKPTPQLSLAALLLASACNLAPAPRDYQLDRVDNTVVVQLYADGFEALSHSDKMLAYHLSQAAIAGRDIFLDQRFEYSLGLRWVLESLWLVRDELPADVNKEVTRYCKLFWVHSGIHDNLTTKKVPLQLTLKQFADACNIAEKAGHDLTGNNIAPMRNLQHAWEIMTDPKTYVSVTNKSTEHGNDPIAASCNNLYSGVTSADLEGFEEKNGLNSRLVKRDGKLIEEIYRCGDGKDIPPGRYAEQISAINVELKKALQYAPAPTKKAITKLIRYNETGSMDDWREFNIA